MTEEFFHVDIDNFGLVISMLDIRHPWRWPAVGRLGGWAVHSAAHSEITGSYPPSAWP
jgi:hypothetical protein